MDGDLKTAVSSVQSWQQLKEDIIQAAPLLGIDKIGFTTADPFLDLKDILRSHREKGYESGFEEPDLDKRVYPHLSFDGPRSILSIAVAYSSKLVNPPKSEKGAYRGIISRTSWGQDYHSVLRNRLERLEAFIKDRVTNAVTMSMVDTGVLVDRAVAERAGVGWSAKNCAVITPEFGSWVFLGDMITNIPFPPDTPITEDCGDCTLCIDSCPTGALVGPGQLNSSLCISFVTQTKGWISDEMKEKIGNRLYGCDTCQVVCPKNRKKNWTHHPEFEPDPELVKPLLKPLLQMTNKQFKEKYGGISASWRGKKPIERNAIIALGNFKDETAVPVLSDIVLHDVRPDMRGTAAWALGKIGTTGASDTLRIAEGKEQDEQVIAAIHRACLSIQAKKQSD